MSDLPLLLGIAGAALLVAVCVVVAAGALLAWLDAAEKGDA